MPKFTPGRPNSKYGITTRGRESHSIPIHVLIRPRMGDFFYTSADLNHEKSIVKALDFPIAGIVVGHMTNEKGVDLGLLRHWRALTPGLELSFHRAFDRGKKSFQCIRTACRSGIQSDIEFRAASYC